MSLSSNYWPLFLVVFMLVNVHVGLSYLCGKKKRGVHAFLFKYYFCQLILLFSLFLLLFMSLTIFFGTIYESHYTISTKFYFYLQYFMQKNFNFSKINRFQMHPQ